MDYNNFTHKNTQKMKKFEKITNYDYVALVPALREYRKKMMGAMGMQPGLGYNRLFTEKREFGARSKYWLTNGGFMMASIAQYVHLHPTITLGVDTYSVDFRWVTGEGTGQSYALYVNKLATANTTKETICGALKTAVQATVTNTKNTENMQNSEATNNAVNNGINIGTPTIGTPYKQYNITIPVALPTGVTFEYKAVVENANPEEFEVIDYEWFGNTSLAANGAVIAQTFNVLLGSDGYNALLKDLEARVIALVKCNVTPEEPAVEPAEDAMGKIDWIAVMRVFEENFAFRQELSNAADNVDVDNAVNWEISNGYGGREFTIDAELDADSIARDMEDSMADAIYDFCKDQAEL